MPQYVYRLLNVQLQQQQQQQQLTCADCLSHPHHRMSLASESAGAGDT